MTAKMSQGISPYDFVQQVYYMQEKTLLDFWPTDDKYREVLIEANLVLKELEAVEDWTWLRETVVLGSCENNTSEILEFKLPEDTYKVSTLNHDSIRLYPIIGYNEISETQEENENELIENITTEIEETNGETEETNNEINNENTGENNEEDGEENNNDSNENNDNSENENSEEYNNDNENNGEDNNSEDNNENNNENSGDSGDSEDSGDSGDSGDNNDDELIIEEQTAEEASVIETTGSPNNSYILDEVNYIPVPIASAGDQRWNREKQTNWIGVNQIHDFQLRAVIHGNVIKLNRPLLPHEAECVLVIDVQKHITPFHVCNPFICKLDDEHKCPSASDVYLTEIPDPNYVIMATAARHAEGSPPALARVAGLQDIAQRILSQMRQNDASATDSDYIEWDVPGYLEVI